MPLTKLELGANILAVDLDNLAALRHNNNAMTVYSSVTPYALDFHDICYDVYSRYVNMILRERDAKEYRTIMTPSDNILIKLSSITMMYTDDTTVMIVLKADGGVITLCVDKNSPKEAEHLVDYLLTANC